MGNGVRPRTLSPEEIAAIRAKGVVSILPTAVKSLIRHVHRSGPAPSVLESLVFPSVPVRWPCLPLTSVHFRALDLGVPHLTPLLWRTPQLSNCSFTDVGIDGPRVVRATFDTCSLIRANIGSRLLGLFDRCEFRQTRFQQARLQGLTFQRCTFSGCGFDVVGTEDLVFRSCTFDDCTFSGTFGHIYFDTCRLTASSFTDCSLREATLQVCALASIRFPDAASCFAVNREALEEVATQAPADIVAAEDAQWLRQLAQVSEVHIVSQALLATFKSTDPAAMVRLLWPLRIQTPISTLKA